MENLLRVLLGKINLVIHSLAKKFRLMMTIIEEYEVTMNEEKKSKGEFDIFNMCLTKCDELGWEKLNGKFLDCFR